MTRLAKMVVPAILAAALAVTDIACEQVHYDMYLGTDAGAGFDAPAREVRVDGAGDDTGDRGNDDAGAVDAGDPTDPGDPPAAGEGD